MDFAQLRQIDNSRTSKTSLSDSVAKEINDMRAIEENAKRGQRVRQREAAITAEINARMDARKNKFGTADTGVTDAVAGKGPFNPSFSKLAKMDPEAAKAELAEVESAMGRGKDAEPTQKFYKGVQHGASGDVPYFTNFPSLADQSVATQVPPNVADLREFKVEGKTRGLGGTNPNDNPELEQKFRMAHEMVEAPAKHAKNVTNLAMKAEERAKGFGVENTLKWLDNLQLTGKHESEFGVGEGDMQRVGADLLQRAKTADQLSSTPNSSYFLPMTEVDAKPGIAADVNSPATILNPGGGRPMQLTEKDRTQGTISGLLGQIDTSTMPAAKRTRDYVSRNIGQPGSQIGRTVNDKGGKRQRTRVGAGELGYDISGMDDMMRNIYSIFGIED